MAGRKKLPKAIDPTMSIGVLMTVTGIHSGCPRISGGPFQQKKEQPRTKNISAKTRRNRQGNSLTSATDRAVGATQRRPLAMGADIAVTSELTQFRFCNLRHPARGSEAGGLRRRRLVGR